MVRLALSAPAADGLYATFNVHVAPAPSVAPQLLPLTMNSVALLLPMFEIVAVAPPLLVTVMLCVALVAPTVTLPNASAEGEACSEAAAGAVPVPLIATEADPPV